jgi:hypothetical protein
MTNRPVGDSAAVANRLSDKTSAATVQRKRALWLPQVKRRDRAVQELQIMVQNCPGSPETSRAIGKLLEQARTGNSSPAGALSFDAAHFVGRYSAFMQGALSLPLFLLPFS